MHAATDSAPTCNSKLDGCRHKRMQRCPGAQSDSGGDCFRSVAAELGLENLWGKFGDGRSLNFLNLSFDIVLTH